MCISQRTRICKSRSQSFLRSIHSCIFCFSVPVSASSPCCSANHEFVPLQRHEIVSIGRSIKPRVNISDI